MLVSMREILERATSEGYGVAAPNIIDERTARACIEAAEEMEAPLVLDVGYVFHPDIVFLGRILEELAVRSPVPIAVNLDHGSAFEHAIAAIRAGFTSVMVDRSMAPYADNVRDTAEIVRIAHAVGVSVEAELGHVGDGFAYEEQGAQNLTDPAEAARYVADTGVDCLAVAVGTAHGAYAGTPHIDFDRLRAIRDAVDIPLVLHGGSGTGEENLKKAVSCGISKVNIGTDLFRGAIAEAEKPGEVIWVYHRMQEGYKNVTKHYIEVLGQAGRAW